MILAQQAIGSILRFALAWASGYLVQSGVWQSSEANAYVDAASAALAFGAVSLGWSLWQKYRAQLKFENR